MAASNILQYPLNSVIEQSALRAPQVDDLPPPNTTRWIARRKAAVVAAVLSGRITIEEVLRRYQLTEEEFLSWQRAFEAHGIAGLRATRSNIGGRVHRAAQDHGDNPMIGIASL